MGMFLKKTLETINNSLTLAEKALVFGSLGPTTPFHTGLLSHENANRCSDLARTIAKVNLHFVTWYWFYDRYSTARHYIGILLSQSAREFSESET